MDNKPSKVITELKEIGKRIKRDNSPVPSDVVYGSLKTAIKEHA